MKPELVDGGIAIDDRGELIFANSFAIADYKRFYVIKNHTAQFVRAWHGHKREGKAIIVLEGAAVIGAVKIDDWDSPDKNLEVTRVVLSSKKPSVFRIPPGYANGIMTMTADTVVLVFSSSSLEDSMGDDFRYPARMWDIWQVEER
jgi:dTDP-4-dehydrorhamnose 3,5-epimerase-like enzyme